MFAGASTNTTTGDAPSLDQLLKTAREFRAKYGKPKIPDDDGFLTFFVHDQAAADSLEAALAQECRQPNPTRPMCSLFGWPVRFRIRPGCVKADQYAIMGRGYTENPVKYFMLQDVDWLKRV
jgi:hypothetical protein